MLVKQLLLKECYIMLELYLLQETLIKEQQLWILWYNKEKEESQFDQQQSVLIGMNIK